MTADGNRPGDSVVELILPTRVSEANLLGNVHGGEIVKLADSAAGAVAQRWSGGPAVTGAIDDLAFLQPVHVGDLLRARAMVNWTGRTSMEIGVRVETQPWDDGSQGWLHVASAYFVFVAIDAEGRPRPVPQVVAGTPEEERRQREAAIRRSSRLARKQEIEGARGGPGAS